MRDPPTLGRGRGSRTQCRSGPVRTLGCDVVQGFQVCRPADAKHSSPGGWTAWAVRGGGGADRAVRDDRRRAGARRAVRPATPITIATAIATATATSPDPGGRRTPPPFRRRRRIARASPPDTGRGLLGHVAARDGAV